MRFKVIAITALLVSAAIGTALVAAENVPAGEVGNPPSVKPSGSPLEEIRATVAELVQVVEKYPGEENVARRRAELRQVIEPRFDFEEMSARSLGANWNQITAEERREFVRLFSDLLADTYLNRIENIRDDTVSLEGERVMLPNAIVRTMVTYKNDRFPIDYRLIARDGKWQVYDVVIENIGLVANYRNEFAGIIRKEKMAGLLRRLREKKGKQ